MGKYTNVGLLTFPKWVSQTNYGQVVPSLEGRTLGRLGIKRTFEHSEGDGNWRVICERCNGTGQLSDDWAIPDEFGHKPGTPCFAECREGWFVLPKPEHFKQAALMVCLYKVRLNAHKEVKTIADSQVRYIESQTSIDTAGGWLHEMRLFWKGISERYVRAANGGPFLSDKDKETAVVRRALRGYEVYLNREEDLICKQNVGVSAGFLRMLVNLFQQQMDMETQAEAEYENMLDHEKFAAQLEELENKKDTLPHDEWRESALMTIHAREMSE